MDKLRFGTAGLPFKRPAPKYPDGVAILRQLGPKGSGGLGHMEMEFVHGVVRKTKDDTPESYRGKLEAYMTRHRETGRIAREHDITLSAHGPYYINLNAKEYQKVEDSKRRVVETAMVGHAAGAFSITFHPAFYLGMDPKIVYTIVKKRLETIVETIRQEGVKLRISPETTGKGSQFGSIDELIGLAEETEGVGICIDFAHLHARSGGKLNTYDEFREVLTKVEDHLGREALRTMHIHLAGIAYSEKGERNHLILRKSDMNYPDLLRSFKDFDIAGAVVCESPNLQGDALLLKRTFDSIS
jgi:deoxyribonuclease IV